MTSKSNKSELTMEKNRTLIEAARTMILGSVLSKQYWNEAVATACYTQNRSTIVKRHLKTHYEIFRKRILNSNFLYVFGCPVYIHNHKDHLGKFDEKADDGYLLGYSLVSKAFRVFNTRRQQTEETYHITFDESPDAIKCSKPSVNSINIAENERYPPDEYLHPCDPSQRYQTNSNDVSFIEPYECPKPVVLETKVSSDQNGQTDQNDQSIFEHSSSPRVLDTSVQDTIPILNPPLPISSEVTPAPQDRWTQDKHIELVNIIGDLGAGMLTRALPKNLIKQSERGISINQEKYVKDLQKKYDINGSSVKTPMVPPNKLGPDLNGKAVNETRYQANPKESYLIVVKRIFKYLKGTPNLGLWYLKCSGFDLKEYSNSDYVGCNMDRKSTLGACQLLGGKLVC
ncbi:retrovirus-related pol polyprotein from transposon TNT 1-94 [Tanacetum coccineum]